jgi:hypothetical protein
MKEHKMDKADSMPGENEKFIHKFSIKIWREGTTWDVKYRWEDNIKMGTIWECRLNSTDTGLGSVDGFI